MEPKGQAAERVLRALGVAIKTFALYPSPHPQTVAATARLLAVLRPYMEAYGPFSVRITKYALSVEGSPFRGGAHGNLALYLYTRKVASIKIMPAVSEDALAAFGSVLAMDRGSLEAAGGARLLLRNSGVGNIQVGELALEEEEALEPFDLQSVFELLGRGRLSAQDRERVLEILRSGPEAARKLLENAYSMSARSANGTADEEQVAQVYQMLRTLDRLVLDEPIEDQQHLYSNLAGASVMVREPLRTLLMRAMLNRDDGEVAARLLGDHLTSEQLAQIVQGSLGRGDTADQVTAFLKAVGTDPKKAQAVLSILDSKLDVDQHAMLADAVLPKLQAALAARREATFPPEFEFRHVEPPSAREESELRLTEARAIDDPAAIREVVLTLMDVLRQDQAEKEMVDVADALVGYLSWLVERQEFGLLARVLQGVKDLATDDVGSRRRVASDVLRKMTEGHLLDILLDALWQWRDTIVQREVEACLDILSEHLVAPLVRALGTESRGGMRSMICDLLARVGTDRVDDLGRFVTDPRWYLVRNVADVLGRVRSPQAVAYLGQLVHHEDYRVRRETLNALTLAGSDEAQGLAAEFLDDPDERLRMRAMQSLGSWEGWKAMPKLLAILDRRDLWNRTFELKRTALETLARLSARQSLPVIKRLAQARLVFSRRGRELRRLAGVTAAIIEGTMPPEAQALLASDDRTGSRP